MKISLRKKIILSFFIGVFVGAIIWGLSYHYHSILAQEMQVIEKRHALFNAILEARRYEKNYLLSSDLESEKKNILQTLAYVDMAEDALLKIIDASRQYPYSYQWPLANEHSEWLEDLNNYKISLASLLKLHEQVGSTGATEEIREKIEKHKSDFPLLGRKITVFVERTIATEYKTVQGMIGKSKYYHLTTFIALSILASLTALFLIFNVNRPLKATENAIKKIAKGDYTNIPTISTGDEFESLVASLNDMINELNKRSEISLQTEKMASLGTLTSGVAHELNNPLNNISTAVQILLEELEDASLAYQKELLERTEKQVERARDTVKALLEFSREGSFSPKLVHVENLVYQTLKLIKGEVPPNVTINVEVPGDIEATMDPRRIQHVMINLIINAVQAMEQGGVLLIKAFRKGNNGEFCLQFQDTGAGISEDDLPKIFDPFFTTKEVGKGSGLGLSVCHGVIEQHGGRIEVASAPGKGTTFSVFLPT
jgi:two-component system NtrC family sensor kinase